MASILQILPLILRQNVGKQTLDRIPEKFSEVTDSEKNVVQYDRVMETKLAISYAIAIETIYRSRTKPFGGRALDVCCGPGHMSITMAKELKLDQLIGVDLSEPMVKVASQNAIEQKQDRVSFRHGDATKLQDYVDGPFDLTTMMDAAHHMPTTDVLQEVVTSMDRMTADDGLFVVMDLVRLRTREITEKYIDLLANDYIERGLPAFKKDFEDSMFAAWTPSEFRRAVPRLSHRKWSLVVPRGLPFAQFLIGHSRDRQPFLKRASLWPAAKNIPVTSENLADYRIAKLTMATATIANVG